MPLWNKLKFYSAVARTFTRNTMARKQEDEAPYLSYLLYKDDICLHIGATDGRHSYSMAKAMKDGNGYILAFEPSPITFPVLEKVIRMHGLKKKIKSERKAFSDKIGRLQLNIPYKTTGHLANSFGYTSLPGIAAKGRHGEDTPNILSFDVEATTIDAVAQKLPKVDFIRMDIEGSERFALNGGWETIRKYKPNMLIEIHPDLMRKIFHTDPQTIYDDFIELGYDIYHLNNGKLVRSPDLNIAPWKDYFFISKDRPNSLFSNL
jgi:FkbM family methyltransferase